MKTAIYVFAVAAIVLLPVLGCVTVSLGETVKQHLVHGSGRDVQDISRSKFEVDECSVSSNLPQSSAEKGVREE